MARAAGLEPATFGSVELAYRPTLSARVGRKRRFREKPIRRQASSGRFGGGRREFRVQTAYTFGVDQEVSPCRLPLSPRRRCSARAKRPTICSESGSCGSTKARCGVRVRHGRVAGEVDLHGRVTIDVAAVDALLTVKYMETPASARRMSTTSPSSSSPWRRPTAAVSTPGAGRCYRRRSPAKDHTRGAPGSAPCRIGSVASTAGPLALWAFMQPPCVAIQSPWSSASTASNSTTEMPTSSGVASPSTARAASRRRGS